MTIAEALHWEGTREFTEITLPAETALLGSTLAFYFATERDVAQSLSR